MTVNDIGRRLLRRTRLTLNQLGLRNSKVFAIGFNKTGTSSLHALFESMARPSYHGVDWRSCNDRALLGRFDCFSDGIPRDLALLDRSFPGARFILQVRELDAWVFSRLAHIDREKARGSHRPDPAWDNTVESVMGWLQQRNRHHMSVFDYFEARPGDLLVVNYARDPDAAGRVARFLDFHGAVAKPERNAKPDRQPPEVHLRLLQEASARLGTKPEEWLLDILCPSLLAPAEEGRYPLDTLSLSPDRAPLRRAGEG